MKRKLPPNIVHCYCLFNDIVTSFGISVALFGPRDKTMEMLNENLRVRDRSSQKIILDDIHLLHLARSQDLLSILAFFLDIEDHLN